MSTNRTEAVIERIRTSIGVKTDAELCRALNLKPQTLSGWKSRDSIPYELCEQVVSKYDASMDWLLTGEGAMYRSAQPAPFDTLSAREEAVLAMFRALDEDAQREIQQVAEEKKRLRDVEQQIKELQALLPHGKRSA